MPTQTEDNIFCFETKEGKYAFNLKPVSIETVLNLLWEDLLPKAAAAEKAAAEKAARDAAILKKFNINKFLQNINLENFQINCDLDGGEESYSVFSDTENDIINIDIFDVDRFGAIEISIYDKTIFKIENNEILKNIIIQNFIRKIIKHYQERGGDYSAWGDNIPARAPLSIAEQEALIESFLD